MISLHYITCHLNRSHFDKRCLICWLWNCCINLSLCLHISQKSHCAILSKYLSICWWKASKNTLLYFWNPLVTSATASLHPKWIMQWWFHSMVLLNWSLALWQVGKKKKWRQSAWWEVFSGLMGFWRLCYHGWGSKDLLYPLASLTPLYPGLEVSMC